MANPKALPHAFQEGEIFLYWNESYGIVLHKGGRGTYSDYNKYTIYRIPRKKEFDTSRISYHCEERLMTKIYRPPFFTKLRLRWYYFWWVQAEFRTLDD